MPPVVDAPELRQYFSTLSSLLEATEVTGANGQKFDFHAAVNRLMTQARSVNAAGKKLIFVGNGGSSTIASHMATDFSKNGNIRALALNDASMVTCLGNDFGYEWIFAKQIEYYAQPGDALYAISSSGRSPNILNAVAAGKKAGCAIITLSGFKPDNPLRQLGDLNFYIASDRYGFVEISHLTICHAALDFLCDLRVPVGSEKTR